jgi:glutathione synthase/RimK-type ligase-like ATP-grasp enzyme
VIKDKSKKEIGFELYQLGIANTTPEYSIKAFEDSAEYETSCFEAFRKELDKEKAQYLEKINKIYTQKKAYLKHLEKKNIEVDKEWIHTFMRQLKYCDTDAQSLALLIENHTEVFVNYLDDMDEKIFRTLKYVARRMPDDVYVKGLKDSLKELGVKSKRSKIIIKRLKAKKMDLE